MVKAEAKVLAVHVSGTHSFSKQTVVCVEEPPKLELAQALQRNAVAAVGHKLVPLAAAPLTVFCSTRACCNSFGGGMERGATLFNWGVILPPESLVAHVVAREYVHMLQAQRLRATQRVQTPVVLDCDDLSPWVRRCAANDNQQHDWRFNAGN